MLGPHCVAYVGRTEARPRLSEEQKTVLLPRSNARRQLSTLQPRPNSRSGDDEAVGNVERAESSGTGIIVLVEVDFMEGGESNELEFRLDDRTEVDESDKLELKLDERLDDKFEETLLTRLLLTALLMELEQLVAHTNVLFGIAGGVGVSGYAHEQIDDTCAGKVHIPAIRDGKLSIMKVVAVVN